jgi:hypothetical protein
VIPKRNSGSESKRTSHCIAATLLDKLGHQKILLLSPQLTLK